MKKPNKILFVTYGGSHSDLVSSLIPEIQRHPDLDYQILALTIASQKLQPLNFRFKRCKDYLPLTGYENALQIGEALSKEIWDETSGIPFEDSCAYLGVSMVDLINQLGEEKAWEAYKKTGRKAFLPTSFVQRVIDHENPDVVVTTCSVRMEQAAHLCALKGSALSIRIEDLLGYSIMGENPITSTEAATSREDWPDRIIVPNDFTRNRMLTAGLEEWRVVALGQPFLSKWLEDSQLPENLANRSRHLKSGTPRITYIMPGRKDALIEQGRALVELAEKRKDWEFLFKLHPGVPKNKFLPHVSHIPDNVSLIYGGDLREILNRTSVILSWKSMVAYLGLLSGIPMVLLNCTGEPDILPYVSEGMAKGVYSYDKLEEALEQTLANQKPVEMKSTVMEITAGAAQRIADYLAGLPTKKNVET